MRIPAFLAAASIAAVSICALAAESVRVAPITAPATGPALLSFAQVFLALALVIGAILGTAWLMRRFTPGHFAGSAQLRIVGGVMVGAKERIVVVELADTWLVLGVTTAQVSTLHTLPRPDDATSAPLAAAPFAERLASILKARGASNARRAAATHQEAETP